MYNILQGTVFLLYLLCKACCCELLLLRDKSWVTQEKMQLLAWSSAFSSGELSGTRKQLSAGLVPVTACKEEGGCSGKGLEQAFSSLRKGKTFISGMSSKHWQETQLHWKVLSQLVHPWQK